MANLEKLKKTLILLFHLGLYFIYWFYICIFLLQDPDLEGFP